VADRLRPWFALAARIVAAAIWLVAGIAKARDLDAFHAQVAAYDALPHALTSWVAYGLPLLEIALGGYLAIGLLIRPAAWLSLGLLAVFLAAQAQAWARGLVIDCGCFGTLQRHAVGAGTMVRDLALAVPTLVLLAVGGGDRWSADRWLHRPPAAGQDGRPATVGGDPRHDDLR
jgi:uncharacterized membrane protein YphA (DoxX/SURF4 family)